MHHEIIIPSRCQFSIERQTCLPPRRRNDLGLNSITLHTIKGIRLMSRIEYTQWQNVQAGPDPVTVINIHLNPGLFQLYLPGCAVAGKGMFQL